MGWSCRASKVLPTADDSAWDGAAAAASMFKACGFDTDHPDSGRAAKGFLAHNSDEPKLKGSYKLPFATMKDGTMTATRGGIRAAASRLSSTDIPASVKASARGVIDHYEKKLGMGDHKKEDTMSYNVIIEADHKIMVAHESALMALPKIPDGNKLKIVEEALSNKDMPPLIYPMFHALRADTMTRNKTYYPKESLQGNKKDRTGIYSALMPYRIPYIECHNTGGSMFGGSPSPTYGRVVNAFMTEGALDGAAACAMILGVPHPEAIDNILNGNWCTVSMGSTTEQAECGLCGADLINEPCECNEDSKTADAFFVKLGPKGFKFREISNVLTPSDVGAQLVDPNVDPSQYKLFAADTRRESVYDLADPTRRNLLDHPVPGYEQEVMRIHESIQWLLDEFAPVRKRYFIANESAHNEEPMITKSELAALPNEAFGVIYTDESTLKVLRRFPFTLATDEASKASLRGLIDAAKSLDAEDRVSLLARLEGAEQGTISISINATNYPELFDLYDSMEAEEALLLAASAPKENEPIIEASLEEPVIETTTEAEPIVEAAPEPVVELAPEPIVEAITEPAPAPSGPSTEDKLAKLYAEMIARQQLSLNAAVASGHTLETLTAHYQEYPLTILEAFYEDLRPTFDITHVDSELIEKVTDPLATALDVPITAAPELVPAETPNWFGAYAVGPSALRGQSTEPHTTL